MAEPSERSASDERIEYPEYYPCYYCEGKRWVWTHGKKRVCPVCHGKGIEPDEDEPEEDEEEEERENE